MVKKAELDILDIEIDEKVDVPKAEDVPLKETAHEEGTATDQTFLDRLRIWARKPLFWIIVAALPLIGIVAGLTFWMLYEPGSSVSAKKMTDATVTGAIKKGNIASFEGFVVDLMDEKSNTRIVLCDITLELQVTRDVGAIESRPGARNAVYMFLKNRKVQELLTVEGRNGLKEDFKDELNRFFGENIVKNVYFSRVEAM